MGTGKFSVPSIDPTSDTLPRSIKQNSDSKITFRLPSGYASDVAIDERGAEKLPTTIKGRGLYKTHELKEMQVPLIEDKEMWERLSKYEVSYTNREETPASGGNSIKFGRDEIRDKGAAPKKKQTRNRSKRTSNIRGDEGVSPNQEIRREEHLLPKRKRKGISRKRTSGEMEPPSGPSSNEK